MKPLIRDSRVSRILAPCALLFAAVNYACSGSGTDTPTQPQPQTPSTPPPQTPSTPQPPPAVNLSAVRIIAGAEQTDTITAVLPQALVVEIRDSAGAIAPGRTVRFSEAFNVSSSPVGQQSFSSVATSITDAQGRAQALVRLGFSAGTARLVVSVPGLGVTDTVGFTVTRGAPARFNLSPRDTAVAPGGSYTLKVLEITDRGGNPLSGLVPTFSATAVSVTSSGQITVPITTPLRAKIFVSYQKAIDSAKVSVYPPLRMVIARHNVAENAGEIPGSSVLAINADGTARNELVRTAHHSISPSSVAATPSAVYYLGDPSANSKVWVVEPNGAPRVLLPGQTRPEAWPRLSPDGTWVYFMRDMKSLWRVKLDGTGLDSLTSIATQRVYQAPTISPDGRSVALEDGDGLQIVDVTTKATRTLPFTCAYPSYSPDGAYFACVQNNLSSPSYVSIVRTDGTGRRVVATFGAYEGPDGTSGVDWTPDGKWLLITMNVGYAVLVEVSTGERLALLALPTASFQTLFVR